jgi:hypothetical protein
MEGPHFNAERRLAVKLGTKLATVLGCLGLATAAWAGQGQSGRGIEIRSIAHATTPPLRSLPSMPSTWRPGTPPRVIPWRKPAQAYKPGLNKGGGKPGGGGSGGGGNWSDPDLQTTTIPLPRQFTFTPEFEGQDMTGAIPPDTNLSVGGQDPSTKSTEIVQTVNTSFAVYDTSGNTVMPSTDLYTLFGNLPASANCNANADGGDVIVLWDQLHTTTSSSGTKIGHWIISQLAYNSNFSQNDFCVAISDGADAAGPYEVYDIPFGSQLPDYPKLAVWGDGIYFSANMFKLKVNPFTGSVSSTFLGAQACSFPGTDVSSPPSNATTTTLTFKCLGSLSTSVYNILPADVDGPAAPPAGPDYYLQFVDNLSSTSGNELMVYQLQSGALVLLGPLTVGTFHEACGGGTCVPQLGTSQQLDSLGDRLMYRLSYRNYGGHEEMVVNHSVQVNSSSSQTGIRWYELCNTSSGSPFSICKQGTFSPDATYRWMGSIAQDSVGDFGLGYSESSNSMDPSVAVTGMDSGLNGGTTDAGMEQEAVILSGPNLQDTYSRWGDYSSMAVDPNDDCTFWYTNEYSTTLNLLGVYNFFWGTVIGSFHFSNCPKNSP